MSGGGCLCGGVASEREHQEVDKYLRDRLENEGEGNSGNGCQEEVDKYLRDRLENEGRNTIEEEIWEGEVSCNFG